MTGRSYLLGAVHREDPVKLKLLLFDVLGAVVVRTSSVKGNGVRCLVHLGADLAVNVLTRGIEHRADAGEDPDGAPEVHKLVMELLALGCLRIQLPLWTGKAPESNQSTHGRGTRLLNEGTLLLQGT